MNEWKSLFWYKKINLRRSPCSAPCILLHRSDNITTKKSSLEMWKSVLHRQLATIWISALLRTDGSVKKFAPIGSLNMLRHGRCSFTTNKISHQSMTTTTKTSHTKQSNLHYKNSIDEKFSMEYRKLFLIGFASFCCVFVPKTCATFSTTQIQLKLATTLSLVFSRASGSLLGFTSQEFSLALWDIFLDMTGCCDYFCFGFTTLILKVLLCW